MVIERTRDVKSWHNASEKVLPHKTLQRLNYLSIDNIANLRQYRHQHASKGPKERYSLLLDVSLSSSLRRNAFLKSKCNFSRIENSDNFQTRDAPTLWGGELRTSSSRYCEFIKSDC
jgi:hypothetical protein